MPIWFGAQLALEGDGKQGEWASGGSWILGARPVPVETIDKG